MSKRDKLFSVEDEVALHPELNREQGGAEDLPEPSDHDGKESSRARYYASTAFEPGLGEGDSTEYREMVRREQARYWMYESINESLKNMFYEDERIEKLIPEYEDAVLRGDLESFSAATELIEKYQKKL